MLKVKLSHAPNPDIVGGYWQHPFDSRRAQRVEVPTMEAAAKAVRAYIERNELGSGNWTGGEITVDGRVIARVSYNGRVWDLAGQEIALAKDTLASRAAENAANGSTGALNL